MRVEFNFNKGILYLHLRIAYNSEARLGSGGSSRGELR